MLSGDDIVVLTGIMASAVALAGFASLVTSIDRSAVGASAAVISFQVRTLIVGAWCAVLLSMLPIAFDALIIAPHSLWQCASMVGAWVLAALLAHTSSGRTHLHGREGAGFSHPLFIANTGLSILATIVAMLGAAGFVPGKGAFLVCIFYLLFLTGTLFYRLIQVADEAARGAKHR